MFLEKLFYPTRTFMSDLLSFMSNYTFVLAAKFDSILLSNILKIEILMKLTLIILVTFKTILIAILNIMTLIQSIKVSSLRANFPCFIWTQEAWVKKASRAVDYCSGIAFIDHDFEVYCFTKPWFISDDGSNSILDNHSNIDCIRYGCSGSGKSLFIHPKHNFNHWPDLKINAPDWNSIFIEISGTDVIVGAICKPACVEFDQFISQLESILSIIIKKKKLCYIAGDFNLDLFIPSKKVI